MSSSIISKEEWLTRWGNASLDALRTGAKEFGHTLRATTKADALDEAYALYAGQLPPHLIPPSAPKPRADLAYEGRVIGHGSSTRHRAGYLFTRHWAPLSPTPTDEQRALLAADPRICVRVAG